ncbi:hypothetical protein FHR92_004395 [Fontibacillus solani]|uniref:DUF1349 domain-containing protein n=1 Tax=Fontibacillus solani TaxID=1572857 RepID=A0A7W3XTL1_9BACL|nr:DUF1349 domain-containing protein [Fontibacillus solani]MBA9087902.1 hypothetical protein [Fontibacillus solani]
MKNVKMTWDAGKWLNSPVLAQIEGDFLRVTPQKGTDFWKKTYYGFEFEDGAALLADWQSGSAIEVSFLLSGFNELYDQAGILLYHGSEQWIKTGIEINDGVPQISAVVTDGYSDWSCTAIPEWVGEEVTIRASVLNEAVIIRARTQRHPWRTVRVARFPYPSQNQAGPYACSPTREGFEVVFTRWEFKKADEDLHIDPKS